MPASQSPSTSTSTFQRQLECDPSVENLTQEESLPQYVENEKSLESCTQSPRSSQSTGSKIKSAVWSFVKGECSMVKIQSSSHGTSYHLSQVLKVSDFARGCIQTPSGTCAGEVFQLDNGGPEIGRSDAITAKLIMSICKAILTAEISHHFVPTPGFQMSCAHGVGHLRFPCHPAIMLPITPN